MKVCTRCRVRPRRGPRQRWCTHCHAAHQRDNALQRCPADVLDLAAALVWSVVCDARPPAGARELVERVDPAIVSHLLARSVTS